MGEVQELDWDIINWGGEELRQTNLGTDETFRIIK